MMDRSLKERVIGAVVLVAAVVLLVPVFLDGPANDNAEIQESIALPGQDASGSKQKTIVLDRDRDQPVPAPRNQAERDAQQKATEEPATTGQPQSSEPSPSEPEPKKTTPAVKDPTPAVISSRDAGSEPPVASSTGMWAVQLGSFSSAENANRLASGLRKEGFAAFLSQTTSGSKSLHRVRIGPQKDRAAAEGVAAKLSAAGHKGQVVPHP